MKNLMLVMFAVMIVGCSAFAGPPRDEVPMMSDAGMMPATDGGHAHTTDAGLIEMPREVDAGPPLGVVPTPGHQCDPDRDQGITYDCRLDGCNRAYIVCLGNGVWRCVPDDDAICVPVPATDAGTVAVDAGSPAVDAGHDAGMTAVTDAGRDLGTDAGPPPVVDAGSRDFCVAGSFVGCWLSCGYPGHIDCNVANGRYDSACFPFEGLECPTPRDAGTDAGPRDAGYDAGYDAGRDMGTDAGTDAGSDAGTTDMGTDAGPTWTPTGVVRMCMDISTPARLLALCPTGGAFPDLRFFARDGIARSSDRASCIDVPMSEIDPGSSNATVWCQTDTAHLSWGGYASPRVIDMPLNTAVSSSDFTVVSINGRPALANTFYCYSTDTRALRRIQVQVVDPSVALPNSCSGTTGTP